MSSPSWLWTVARVVTMPVSSCVVSLVISSWGYSVSPACTSFRNLHEALVNVRNTSPMYCGKRVATRSSEGENLQSMHHRSSMTVSARVLDIIVDRVIVSRNRLESGSMRIRQCAAWCAEYGAEVEVLAPSRGQGGKAD